MSWKAIALVTAVLTSISGAASAQDRTLAEAGDRPLVAQRLYFEAPRVRGGSPLSGLVLSLDRARRNGISGSGRPTRVLSLDQALFEKEWRESVSRRLGDYLGSPAPFQGETADSQAPGFAF